MPVFNGAILDLDAAAITSGDRSWAARDKKLALVQAL
jgi:hypothetical protein